MGESSHGEREHRTRIPLSTGCFEKWSGLLGHRIHYSDDVDLNRGSVGSPFGVGGAGIDLGL